MSTDVGTIVGYLRLDDTQFNASIDEAIAKLHVLSGTDVKVKFDVSQVSEVKAAAEEAVTGLDSIEKKSAETDSSFRGHASAMVTAIALLGPAMVPIAAGATGLGIGFAGMAAAGILAFKGIEAEMAQGTTAGLNYRAGLDTVSGALSHLESIAATNILGDFQSAVTALSGKMPILSQDIGNLATLAGHAGASLATGLLNVFIQLAPVMETAGVYLDQLAAHLANLSSGSGVRAFADYMMALMPKVISLVTGVITVVVRLIAALSPFGGAILDILLLFINALNAIPIGMLTNLATIAASVFAGFKAWEAISGIVEGVVTAVKALNTSIEISASTMRVFDIATGVFGIAIAAISLVMAKMSESSQEAAQQEEELVRAFEDSNGAIDENIRVMMAKELQDQGVYTAAQQLGLSIKTVTDAALNNTDAIKAVHEHMDLVGKSMQNAGLDATNLVGDTTDVQGAMDKVNGAISGTNKTINDAHTKWQQLHDAEAQTTPAAAAAAVAQQALATSLGSTVPALQAAQKAQADEATQAANATTKMQLENDAAGLLKQALDALDGKAMNAAQAQNQFESSLIGMTKAATKGGSAAKGAGASIGGMSQQSVNARQALLQQVQAAEQSAEANGGLSGSSEHARATLVTLRDEIVRNAVAHGYNKQSVENYIDSVLHIPKVAGTRVDVAKKAADAAIKGVMSELDALNGKVATVVVRTVQETDRLTKTLNPNTNVTPGGELRVSNGYGAFFGGVRAFAAGGFDSLPSTAAIMPDGSNLVQYAETGTGGEAYIPLGGYNRSRSVAIWEETGRRLGVSAGAQSLVGISIVGTLDTPWGPSQIRGVVQDEMKQEKSLARIAQRAGVSAEGSRR